MNWREQQVTAATETDRQRGRQRERQRERERETERETETESRALITEYNGSDWLRLFFGEVLVLAE